MVNGMLQADEPGEAFGDSLTLQAHLIELIAGCSDASGVYHTTRHPGTYQYCAQVTGATPTLIVRELRPGVPSSPWAMIPAKSG